MDARSRSLGPALGAALIAALLCLPAVARAAPPSFVADPVLEGELVVGSTLQVTANAAATDPPTTVNYQWLRCATPDLSACLPIGMDAPTYTLTSSDVDRYMAVTVSLTNAEGPSPEPRTAGPWGPVAARQTPPPPPPVITPTPTPTPIAAASTVLPIRPAFLRPFPVVRIRGFFARRGARISLLSVKGPRSARVYARCVGRGCPVRTLTMFPADGRLRRFERFLRAGIKIQIRVIRPGRIGSYTSFLIRRRKAPLRTDRCVTSTTAKPVKCSSP